MLRPTYLDLVTKGAPFECAFIVKKTKQKHEAREANLYREQEQAS